MFYPRASCEAEGFHRKFCAKIKALNPDSDTFDTDWKQLLLGGTVAELVIHSTKYGCKDYPYNLLELMTCCGEKPSEFYNDEQILNRVNEMGRQILSKKLPFKFEHIDRFSFKSGIRLKILLAELVKEYDLDQDSVWSDSLMRLPKTARVLGFFGENNSEKDDPTCYSAATSMSVG
jgi:hypothetical protein